MSQEIYLFEFFNFSRKLSKILGFFGEEIPIIEKGDYENFEVPLNS